MSALPLTAVRVQQMLREVDAELARGKPTDEALSLLLQRLAPAYRPGFFEISVTSPITGRGVLLAQLWYKLLGQLEELEAVEQISRRAG